MTMPLLHNQTELEQPPCVHRAAGSWGYLLNCDRPGEVFVAILPIVKSFEFFNDGHLRQNARHGVPLDRTSREGMLCAS